MWKMSKQIILALDETTVYCNIMNCTGSSSILGGPNVFLPVFLIEYYWTIKIMFVYNIIPNNILV